MQGAVDPLPDVQGHGQDGEGGQDDEDAHHVGDFQLRRRLVIH